MNPVPSGQNRAVQCYISRIHTVMPMDVSAPLVRHYAQGCYRSAGSVPTTRSSSGKALLPYFVITIIIFVRSQAGRSMAIFPVACTVTLVTVQMTGQLCHASLPSCLVWRPGCSWALEFLWSCRKSGYRSCGRVCGEDDYMAATTRVGPSQPDFCAHCIKHDLCSDLRVDGSYGP